LLRAVPPFRPGPATGAATSLHLATSPTADAVTGAYYTRSRPTSPSPLATDPTSAKRPWALSQELPPPWLPCPPPRERPMGAERGTPPPLAPLPPPRGSIPPCSLVLDALGRKSRAGRLGR